MQRASANVRLRRANERLLRRREADACWSPVLGPKRNSEMSALSSGDFVRNQEFCTQLLARKRTLGT